MIDFMQRPDTFAMGESAWSEWQELTKQTPDAALMRRVIDEHMEHIGDLQRQGVLVAGDQAVVLTEIKGTNLALVDIWTDQRECWLVSCAAGHRIARTMLSILKGETSHASQ